MLPTKFRFNWLSSSREEDFQKWTNQNKRSNLYREPYIDKMLSTKFQFIWESGFGEDFLRNQPIRNKNCLWWPCLLMDRNEMSSIYRGPFIDTSYQVSVQLPKQFQGRIFFRNQPIRNKNGLWWSCLLTNRDEKNLQRTFHRCCFRPSFSSFCQTISENIFKNRPLGNNCLWRPCLLMDRDKMSNLYRGPSIDASY